MRKVGLLGPGQGAMTAEAARHLATDGLLWLLRDEAALAAFLAQSGASADDLRAAAADPAFLGFALDHLLADEPLLLRAAEAMGCPPADIARARAALPGGAEVHWT